MKMEADGVLMSHTSRSIDSNSSLMDNPCEKKVWTSKRNTNNCGKKVERLSDMETICRKMEISCRNLMYQTRNEEDIDR
uniref:Uncharacterized protein n=1 Tax=Arion vulgaris TaxID=1028688 RepID=A0A0B7B739_9EUPU